MTPFVTGVALGLIVDSRLNALGYDEGTAAWVAGVFAAAVVVAVHSQAAIRVVERRGTALAVVATAGTVFVVAYSYAASSAFDGSDWESWVLGSNAGPVGQLEPEIAALSMLLTGALVGVSLRQLLVLLIEWTLTGRARELVETMLIAAIVLVWVLAPSPDSGPALVPIYVVGIGIGFALHFTTRTLTRSLARRERRHQRITHFLKQADLSPAEEHLVMLYARDSHDEIIELIDEGEPPYGDRTSAVCMIHAAALRDSGRFTDAIEVIDLHLAEDVEATLKPNFLVLKGLCLGERNELPRMWNCLLEALHLEPECMLGNLTWGIRTSEWLIDGRPGHQRDARLSRGSPFPTETEMDRNVANEAIHHVWTALQVNSRNHELTFGEHVLGMSITWTSLLDSYAYALLAYGDLRLSRTVLSICLREDAGYAWPYLHLGEWYVRAREACDGNDNPWEKVRLGELAEICFMLAKHLAAGDGLVRDRALAGLDSIGEKQRHDITVLRGISRAFAEASLWSRRLGKSLAITVAAGLLATSYLAGASLGSRSIELQDATTPAEEAQRGPSPIEAPSDNHRRAI